MNFKSILTAAFLVISLSVFAQTEIDDQVKKMTETVALTKDQQVKYKNYLINKNKDKEALQEKYKDDSGSQAKKDAQTAFKEKYNAEFKKILTADQLKKLEEAKNAKK